MSTQTHKVEVVRVQVEPHPNAERLDVARIFGFTCCVVKGQFKDGDLGAYIQPDSIVDSGRREFEFLKGHERIKVKRLRGVISMGLLLEAPVGFHEGEDVAEYFGVTHYEPPLPASSCGESEPGPLSVYTPKYDVESMYRFKHLFVAGEPVVATEKLHGANARFMYSVTDDRMFCGSRGEWKAFNKSNLWWRVLAAEPWIEEFCREHPGSILYGEAFGNVQSLKYGAGKEEVFFRAFDILQDGEWAEFDALTALLPCGKLVPIVYAGPFDFEHLVKLSDGPSLIPGADNVREGIVVRPVPERRDLMEGRVHLKMVGNSYLEKDRS